MFKVALFVISFLANNSFSNETFMPLKDIISHKDFFKDEAMIDLLYRRCSALHFAAAAITKSNSVFDGSDKIKINKRNENIEKYLHSAESFFVVASEGLTGHSIEILANDIEHIKDDYIKKAQESQLSIGPIQFRDDLMTCKSFIEFVSEKYNSSIKNKK